MLLVFTKIRKFNHRKRFRFKEKEYFSCPKDSVAITKLAHNKKITVIFMINVIFLNFPPPEEK